MTKDTAVDFLIGQPAAFARLVGFDKLTDLHNSWICDMIRGEEDKTLLASRGTYKTTSVALGIAILMLIYPNKRILFMRKTDANVKEIVATVSKILKTPAVQYFTQQMYGVNLRLIRETQTEISTNLITDIKGTEQLTGKGCGLSITGKHYDYIFTDDIVNVEDRVSQAEREKTKLIYQELRNIINRGGRIFNTGTPWHEEDAFSIMPKAEKYDCYHSEVKKIISEQELENLKAGMLPSLFAANYELRFIPSEDVIFRDARTGEADEKVMNGIMHIDAAFYGEDFTAWTVGINHGGKLYIRGKCKRKHIQDCYEEIQADYEKFLCPKIYIEDNADKGMVAKELRKLGMKVVTYHESMNKYLKIVTHLKSAWDKLYFTEGTEETYIKQVLDFYENAAHDDAPDSAACIARLLNKRTDREYSSLYGGVVDMKRGIVV